MDRCKISEWEGVVGAPDRVNIPWFMHDDRLCQMDVNMRNNVYTELKRCKYKTFYDV